MPWTEKSAVSQRVEFVQLAQTGDVPMTVLCERYRISRKTGYKWLERFSLGGAAELADRSRRPRRAPRQTNPALETAILAERDAHPVWGGRKIRARLQRAGLADVPAASTITQVLRRHGRIDPDVSAQHQPPQRFEHPRPNDLWQMDFKGHFAAGRGRCHPLTVLDDHSRFSLCLAACSNQREETVQQRLIGVFERYGLPDRMLMDNGSPFAGPTGSSHSSLTAWLIRLGIRITHGRPYHPQTQGKEERFHRTLLAEVIRGRTWEDLDHCQRRFDDWRDEYNQHRPHEALGLAVPASRYQPSRRSYPACLPGIEYGPDDIVRIVQGRGEISYRCRKLVVGKAFFGLPVALRPTRQDGVLDIYFCQQRVGNLDLRVLDTAERGSFLTRSQIQQDFTETHRNSQDFTKKKEAKKKRN
jgi:transposase InsO family protein